MRIGWCRRKPASTYQRQVGPVITYDSGLVPLQVQLEQAGVRRPKLVINTKIRVNYAQGRQAHPQGVGVTAGDDDRDNARLAQ